MTAPTAGSLIRQLDARRTQAQIAVLADLDDAAQAEVRRVLGGVRGSARVDVPKLISTVQASIVARAERKAQREPDAAGILKYRLSLMADGDLTALRDDLVRRVEAGEGDQPFEAGTPGAMIMSRLDAISARLRAPDDAVEQPDDEPDEQPARRSIPRVRSRSAARESSAPTEAPQAALRPRSRAHGLPRAATGPFLGGRLLGPGDPGRPFGASIDFDRSYRPMRPPWLLDDDDPDPDEQETDHGTVETRVADAY